MLTEQSESLRDLDHIFISFIRSFYPFCVSVSLSQMRILLSVSKISSKREI